MSQEPVRPVPSHTYMEEGDEALVIKAQAGEETAFSALMARYQNRICGVIFHLLWDRQEAEDLAPEVFVRAYRNLGKFRREAKSSPGCTGSP